MRNEWRGSWCFSVAGILKTTGMFYINIYIYMFFCPVFPLPKTWKFDTFWHILSFCVAFLGLWGRLSKDENFRQQKAACEMTPRAIFREKHLDQTTWICVILLADCTMGKLGKSLFCW